MFVILNPSTGTVIRAKEAWREIDLCRRDKIEVEIGENEAVSAALTKFCPRIVIPK